MQKLFALIDCNNFYVSCERLFNPKLRDKPMAVLSQNDGCIVARSNEVKKLGVPMGAPYFSWEPILRRHRVIVYSSNYQLYGDISARVMQTLRSDAPHVEQYSIDEAFCELSSCAFAQDAKGRQEYMKATRAKVLQWTGIPTAIGMGPTKTLAKIATKIAKTERSNFFDITSHPDMERILADFDVADIWGIGRQYKKMLYSYGIRTAKKLMACNDAWIQKKMTIVGLKTVWELRGISCFQLEEQPAPKQAIAYCKSFGTPIKTLAKLKESVAEYVAQAAAKARAQKSMPRALYIFINTSRFASERYANSHAIALSTPTNYTPFLIEQAQLAVERMYKAGYAYKKAGAILLDLIPESEQQEALFQKNPNSLGRTKASHTLDLINKKWGKKSVFYAAQGIGQEWKVRPMRKSSSFTTNWRGLAIVKAF